MGHGSLEHSHRVRRVCGHVVARPSARLAPGTAFQSRGRKGEERVSVFSIDLFYELAGLVLTFVAVRTLRIEADRRRWGTAGFWGLLAIIYLFGKNIPPLMVGWMMLAMVTLAAAKLVGHPVEQTTSAEERTLSASRLRNKLFLPA